jgi:hypothetical protein
VRTEAEEKWERIRGGGGGDMDEGRRREGGF